MTSKQKLLVGIITIGVAGTVLTVGLRTALSTDVDNPNSLSSSTSITQQEEVTQDPHMLEITLEGQDNSPVNESQAGSSDVTLVIEGEQPSGSGEAEMQESAESEVYVDPTPEESENSEEPVEEPTETQEGTVQAEINTDGAAWGFGDIETNPELPTEEDMQWAADMIDQNGTVLH